MAGTLTVQANFAGGPGRTLSFAQNVATAGTPLTTTPVTLFTLSDAAMKRRSLLVNWTGDQTLTLRLQYDLGSGGNGLQTIAEFDFVAGNATAQTAMFFRSVTAGLPAGTSLISGTQPTLAAAPAVANTEFLWAVADRIAVVALAGGTTTVGALTLDINETD